jgi:hypothetical protein
MSFSLVSSSLVTPGGGLWPGGSITVYLPDDVTLVPIYYDSNGTQPISGSVVTSDVNGAFSFYVLAGTVIDLYIQGFGINSEWLRGITPPYTDSGNIASIPRLSSDPSTGGLPVPYVFYNTTDTRLKMWNGTRIVLLG